jgi:hypothetical protein
MASAFPLGFCGFPGMWIVLYACLTAEFIGLTHIAWPLANAVEALMGPLMRNDEYYIDPPPEEPPMSKDHPHYDPHINPEDLELGAPGLSKYGETARKFKEHEIEMNQVSASSSLVNCASPQKNNQSVVETATM